MATIHLIDGEKGGVGKSFVARTMIQYCLDRDLPMIAVETDRSNPDVAGVYKEICQYAVLTEDEKQADKADRIFEMAIDFPCHCLFTFSSSSGDESMDRSESVTLSRQ